MSLYRADNMAIPVPTIDDFKESTVMLVIRNIVDYLKDTLVPDINKADVANITTSISGQNLTINIVFGDGTVKSTTVVLPEGGGGGESGPYPTGVTLSLSGTTLNFNMTMSNGTPITGSVNLAPILEGYATDEEVTEIQSDLQEQITGIALTKNITQDSSNVISITDSINGTSTQLKLDISYVSPNLVLTASNTDGTVQAHSQTELILDTDSDLEFINAGLTAEELYNKLVTYSVRTEIVSGGIKLISGDIEELEEYTIANKEFRTMRFLKDVMIVVTYNKGGQYYFKVKEFAKNSTIYVVAGNSSGNIGNILIGDRIIELGIYTIDRWVGASIIIGSDANTSSWMKYASNLTDLFALPDKYTGVMVRVKEE